MAFLQHSGKLFNAAQYAVPNMKETLFGQPPDGRYFLDVQALDYSVGKIVGHQQCIVADALYGTKLFMDKATFLLPSRDLRIWSRSAFAFLSRSFNIS
jgi:hypothetical protein